MSLQPGWPDWITAVSTALTAILTGFAGFAAVVALRRDTKRQQPIVEPKLRWSEGYILASITVRNRLPESIIITSAEVKKPRRAKISYGRRNVSVPIGNSEPIPPELQKIPLNIDVAPIGTEPNRFDGILMSAGEARSCEFYIQPPAEWRGGNVRIDLRISSMALTIRDRRMVITRTISAPPTRQTDEKASKPA
jgi:hypothetical protein